MLSASGVVGRPISALRVWLSSNRPPFDAPVSESAQHLRQPGRQADALQRGGKIGLAQVRYATGLPLCLLSSAASSLSVHALSPASS